MKQVRCEVCSSRNVDLYPESSISFTYSCDDCGYIGKLPLELADGSRRSSAATLMHSRRGRMLILMIVAAVLFSYLLLVRRAAIDILIVSIISLAIICSLELICILFRRRPRNSKLEVIVERIK